MGKSTSTVDKVSELANALPSVQKVVVISSSGKAFDASAWPSTMRDKVIGWADFLDGGDADPVFTRVPFSHPQFVLYSSGTTGMPKSIAHGCGNTLLQHGKELVLHGDLREGDKMLFYTYLLRRPSIVVGAADAREPGRDATPRQRHLGVPRRRADAVTGTSRRWREAPLHAIAATRRLTGAWGPSSRHRRVEGAVTALHTQDLRLDDVELDGFFIIRGRGDRLF